MRIVEINDLSLDHSSNYMLDLLTLSHKIVAFIHLQLSLALQKVSQLHACVFIGMCVMYICI